MLSDEDVKRIADAWVEAFSVEPYVVGAERDMAAWHELDDLIATDPRAALCVFEKIAEKDDLINWTFEGIAVGPIRTFLISHDHRFETEVSAIRRRNKAFDEMHGFAVEGL